MFFHQMNPQQQFQWNWMFWFRALVKFQMLFEIESRLQQRQQTKTLTCNFRPESENVDAPPEWDLSSQPINLLKVFIFFFPSFWTKLFQFFQHLFLLLLHAASNWFFRYFCFSQLLYIFKVCIRSKNLNLVTSISCFSKYVVYCNLCGYWREGGNTFWQVVTDIQSKLGNYN